ncbi:MAG: SafA/ExsA family spore coat assembly protein [Dethiobacteria bacterium]
MTAHDLKVKKRLLKVQQVVGEKTSRQTITATAKLPVSATKIFDVDATVRDVETEVREGGVFVRGVIHKQIFFVDAVDVVRMETEDVPFQKFIEVAGARPRMNVQVHTRIVDIDARLVKDGRAVEQNILLEIFVKVTETEQLEVVVDVKNDVVVKKKLLRVESVIGENIAHEVLMPKIILPVEAVKIFRIVAEARDLSVDVKEDTAVVKGTVHKQIFFVDRDNIVRHEAEDVPFSVAIDIPGARPGMEAQVDVEVIVTDFDLKDPPGKKLHQTVVLDVFVKVVEPIQLEVVVDVEGKHLIVEKKLLKVENVISDVTLREAVRSEVTLPEKAIKVFEVLGSLNDVEAKVLDGQVVVSGVLHKQIFFVDTRDVLRHFREDVPFRLAGAAPGALPDMNVVVRPRIIGDIDFRLVDDKIVEQTVVIEAFVKITEDVQLEVVIDVKSEKKPKPPQPKPPMPPRPPKPQKVYIVQKGDTLFKIAKRFGVPLDALIAANPQLKDPNLIFPGDRIIIPTNGIEPPKPPHGRVYIVQKGDTLFKIAKRFGVSLDALIAANSQIKNPNRIFPGDKVFIPN